eukprot:FR735685.1.p3 GENE.FR735685.1~~FR735685.1.p3  ORF type:complete len:112 (+),score=34.85 FR735685.1:634-969(+)
MPTCGQLRGQQTAPCLIDRLETSTTRITKSRNSTSNWAEAEQLISSLNAKGRMLQLVTPNQELRVEGGMRPPFGKSGLNPGACKKKKKKKKSGPPVSGQPKAQNPRGSPNS